MQRVDNHLERGRARLELATTLILLGDTDEPRELLTQSIAELEQAGARYLTARAELQLARISHNRSAYLLRSARARAGANAGDPAWKRLVTRCVHSHRRARRGARAGRGSGVVVRDPPRARGPRRARAGRNRRSVDRTSLRDAVAELRTGCEPAPARRTRLEPAPEPHAGDPADVRQRRRAARHRRGRMRCRARGRNVPAVPRGPLRRGRGRVRRVGVAACSVARTRTGSIDEQLLLDELRTRVETLIPPSRPVASA